MSAIVASQSGQALRREGGRRRHQLRGWRRRVPGVGRPQRLRQDDDAAAAGRSGSGDQRRDRLRRADRHQPAAEGSERGHGLPGLRHLSAPDGLREHRLWAALATRSAAGDRAARESGGPDLPHRPSARAQAAPVERRRTAAGGAVAGDGARCRRLPLRRAALEPRCPAALPGAGGRAGPASRQAAAEHLRDPRPVGGHGARGPHRRHARRHDPADRHRGRSLLAAAQPVRRVFHRHAKHQPVRRRGASRRRGGGPAEPGVQPDPPQLAAPGGRRTTSGSGSRSAFAPRICTSRGWRHSR